MKKLITKVAIVVLMLTAMPLKSWAQTPYRPYADEGIAMNFLNIDNIDFRAFLLYNISKDERFVLIPEEEYGQFILTPKEENGSFLESFESFYQDVTANFAMLSKNDIYDQMNEWKDSVSPQDFLSITMDVALRNTRTDNEHCVNSLPFCTTDLIQFEAASTDQTATEPGMDDGCIGSSYNPSFYHMRIHTAGQFVIHMEGHDPTTGVDRDIDFCMWGPYEEEQIASGWACSHLTSDKIIDCCYSADETEDVYLGYPADEHHHNTSHGTINYHRPEVGEYYILMITNFSRQPCVINFTKTPGSGPGETDCDILPGIVNNDGPYCEGETIHLTVNEQMNASYSWTGPNGFVSDLQNPTIENCTMEMAGIYTCVTTVGTQTTEASTTVVIYQQPTPSFTATTVCEGEATSFEGMASGTNVANYDWDFGDDEIGSGQIINHTYAEAGTYQVTLVVTAEDGTCPGEITQTVIVNAMPVPTATADPSLVIYDGTSTLTGDAGIPGSFTYHWEPSDMVTDPNSPTTQTVPLHATQVYTLTVTNTEGGCTSTIQVAVSMEGSNLAATAYAEENQLCENHSTTIHATPTGGTGNYTYSWTGPDGFTSTQQAPMVTPPVGTSTYTCQVGDGLVTQQASVTITVNPKHETSITETECDLFIWDPQGHTFTEPGHSGNNYDESGSYIRTYTNQYGCDSIVTLNLTVYKSLSDTKTFDNTCDYDIQFEWFGEPIHFDEDGSYTFDNDDNPIAQTIHGCDTTMTVRITNLRFAPNPSPIFCTDDGAVVYGPDHDTMAVVTNTEFFSFQYVFRVEERGHSKCDWEDCVWSIDKPSWAIDFGEPERTNGYFGSECTVFVAEQDDNIVTLTATISNGCGTEERKFYLKSSFLSIDDNEGSAAKVSIVPNPNNGQMHISFEDMEGPTIVKVLDMTGHQIDSFEANVGTKRHIYDYTMKQHAKGIYLFVIANNDKVFTKKVVIIQ